MEVAILSASGGRLQGPQKLFDSDGKIRILDNA